MAGPSLQQPAPQTLHLLGDRFREFSRLARESGALSQGSSPSAASSSAAGPDGRRGLLLRSPRRAEANAVGGSCGSSAGGGARSFLRAFFDSTAEFQRLHGEGQQKLRLFAEARAQLLTATQRAQESEASRRFAALVEETDAIVAAQQDILKAIGSEPDEGRRENVAEKRIRDNLKKEAVRRHQKFLLDFRDAQLDFKKALEGQNLKQMRLLCPEASEEEVQRMAEVGQTPATLVLRRVAGAHALLLEELRHCEEKHQDILRLEQGVTDLAQMFQEVAVLVDSQGELLDSVEANVRSANEHTHKAEKQLITTRKYQTSTRKWQCALMVFCTILVLIMLFPILIRI